MLSSLFTEYEQTQRIALSKMSPDQVRKWTSAKKRAVEILIEQKGDKPLHQLSRDDALSYSDWWEDRVLTEGIGAGTANKNISHIGGMIRAVNKRLKLGLDDVFAATRIEAVATDNARRSRRIHPRRHSCAGQARRIERGSARRGLRRDGNRRATERDREPDCGADRARRADPVHPHRAEGRVLKTEHSERDIPLVGLALAAMRRHADGFPRYFDKGSSLSAT